MHDKNRKAMFAKAFPKRTKLEMFANKPMFATEREGLVFNTTFKGRPESERCRTCTGTGINNFTTCKKCNGSGKR